MNALARLRERLGATREQVAQALGIQVVDVETLERTPFRLIEIDAIERFAAAVGCRLDVVAVHVDGVAHWLSPEAP